MGLTKKEAFTDLQVELAELAKAIGHPARVAIIQFLVNHDACVCGDIVDELPLSQSTVSQHLKALKQIGLIKGEIDGPSVCYCINQEKWSDVQDMFGVFFKNVLEKYNCC